MKKKELIKEVKFAIESYLAFLQSDEFAPDIANAIHQARILYQGTEYLPPLQIALLQRCFQQAREGRYAVDWMPVAYLEPAIAEELDGSPRRMLQSADVVQAIGRLAIGDFVSDELKAWHNDIENQLLLTGWLAPEALLKLRWLYLSSHGNAAAASALDASRQ